MSGGGGARGLWGPLLAGVGDTGSKPKPGSGDAISRVGPRMPAEMTGVPAMAAHIDMTHAGPHGQMRYPLCPEPSPPADPCSAQISLEVTALDARQEMIRNPDIATCIAMAEATNQPIRLLKGRRDLILVGNRAKCAFLSLPSGRSDFKSARHDTHGGSIADVAYSGLTPREGLNALIAIPVRSDARALDGILALTCLIAN